MKNLRKDGRELQMETWKVTYIYVTFKEQNEKENVKAFEKVSYYVIRENAGVEVQGDVILPKLKHKSG